MSRQKRVGVAAAVLAVGLAGCGDSLKQAPAGSVARHEVRTPEELQAEAMRYSGRGIVRAVDVQGMMITIEHQGISGFMPAPALMTFLLDNTELLNKIEVGDVVDFTIEHTPAFAKVVELSESVLPPTTPPSPR